MNGNKRRKAEIPEWVLWLAEHGFSVLALVGFSFLVAIAIVAYWLDRRLDGIEGRINQKPPQSYAPPDLEQYAAPEIPEGAFVRAQSVYVPVYSHAYFGGGRPVSLEVTLSIRNTSETKPVFVESVRYYDTDGELVKKPVDRLIRLKPLQTVEFLIAQRDNSGGSGANFLVDWLATDADVVPVIEVAMIGNAGTQGVCLRASGIDLPSSKPGND